MHPAIIIPDRSAAGNHLPGVWRPDPERLSAVQKTSIDRARAGRKHGRPRLFKWICGKIFFVASIAVVSPSISIVMPLILPDAIRSPHFSKTGIKKGISEI